MSFFKQLGAKESLMKERKKKSMIRGCASEAKSDGDQLVQSPLELERNHSLCGNMDETGGHYTK